MQLIQCYRSTESNGNFHTVHTAHDAAPQDHSQPQPTHPGKTPHAVRHGLILLMMGIMMSETCWDRNLIINIELVASCWFSLFTYCYTYWAPTLGGVGGGEGIDTVCSLCNWCCHGRGGMRKELQLPMHCGHGVMAAYLGCWGSVWEGRPGDEYFIPAFPTFTFQDFI